MSRVKFFLQNFFLNGIFFSRKRFPGIHRSCKEQSIAASEPYYIVLIPTKPIKLSSLNYPLLIVRESDNVNTKNNSLFVLTSGLVLYCIGRVRVPVRY